MQYLKKLNIKLVKGDFKNSIKGQVRDPQQIYNIFKKIKDDAYETLIGVYLSEKMEAKAYDVLSTGGRHMTLFPTHEIFERVILSRLRAFILVHNHPSGNPTPSFQDKRVINTLKEQSIIMQCKFVDFIIVGDDCYWSMNKGGYTPSQ